MNLRCIAIDESEPELAHLHLLASHLPQLDWVASFTDPFAALSWLQVHPVDLILLGSDSPLLNGLEFIGSIRQRPFVILFSSDDRFALGGYAHHVVDYLVKPYEPGRFYQACNKVHELFHWKTAAEGNQQLPRAFFINVDGARRRIRFDDILYVEGLRDYVRIHLSGQKPIVARCSLKQLDQTLPATQFVRIHKSYIVSSEQVTAVRPHSVLIGAAELPVSAGYHDALAQILRGC
jgi:two-component system LytT family response regulator